MKFKDYATQDLAKVFFNPDEFCETVIIDGQTKVVYIDQDELKKRVEEYGGITTGMILYYIPVSEYGSKVPRVGETQIFKNKLMYIEDVKENAGVYEITLNQNRGERCGK
jgi:hypothetical protein